VAAIALKHVGKVYPDGHAAARDLNLDIADGELLVLLGPSGSGKSTVLRLIAGLEAPTAGRVFIDGRDVTAEAASERDLAMVFQSYALYPHKTVRENLAFALKVRRLDAASIESRVRRTATTLGIEPLLDRKPAQLSGGQRQRVALGRAIVREPKAFLLDEPLSNLDPLLRIDTRAEIALLHRRLAATMVYVTHDQEEAMTLGTRVAVMRDGRLEQVGAPLEVFRSPANTFVARFVGTPAMNLVPCAAERSTGGARIVCPAFSIDVGEGGGGIDGEGGAGIARGSRLVAGIRPHDIDLADPDGADARGRVEIVEPLGAQTLIHVSVDAMPDPLVRVVVAAETRVAVDDRVGLRFRRDRLHLFDEPTGARV
jgi:ABC-type sugar transport system ATPase subunit